VVPVGYFFDNLGIVRYASSVCTVTVDDKARKFMFTTTMPTPLPHTSTHVIVADTCLVVTNDRHAHGFQIGDVVTLERHTGKHHLVVAQVPSGTSFVLDIYTTEFPPLQFDVTGRQFTANPEDQQLILDTALVANIQVLFTYDDITYAGTVVDVTADTTTIDFAPNTLPASCVGVPLSARHTLAESLAVYSDARPKLNLLFGTAAKTRGFQASMLGFEQSDVLWNPHTPHLASPFTYHLQPPSYVLIQMLTPASGSARFEAGHATNIVGKVVLLPHPSLGRFYPMTTTFFSCIKVDHVHLRILNPDHTLYQLHNHNWSATIRLHMPDK
jgi:hypothetical protein